MDASTEIMRIIYEVQKRRAEAMAVALPKRPPSCATCRHWYSSFQDYYFSEYETDRVVVAADFHEGSCHRHAPISMTPPRSGYPVTALWPPTNGRDLCGDYELDPKYLEAFERFSKENSG